MGINLEAKLADFSFVQKFSYGFDLIGHPNEFIPIRWLPKETLEDIVYNTYTDVWMFGVFLWELMSLGKDPYHEYDLNEVIFFKFYFVCFLLIIIVSIDKLIKQYK